MQHFVLFVHLINKKEIKQFKKTIMKSLKMLIVAFTVLASSVIAKADEGTKMADKASLKFSIAAYVDMLKNGNSADYISILSENVKFNHSRNGKIISHGKKEEINFINSLGRVKQNCKTDYSILSTGDKYCLVKVRMVYETFVKEDFISLSQSEKGWQVTDVTSVFGS